MKWMAWKESRAACKPALKQESVDLAAAQEEALTNASEFATEQLKKQKKRASRKKK